MNRVIRTARIAAQPVILPIHVDRGVVDLSFVSDEDAFSEEDFEAAQAQDVDESTEFTALGDQAEVVEEEPKLSMEEVEALIAERVQEVETRLLQEKEQEKEAVQEAAQQAGLEAGQAQGYADGHAAGLAEGQVQSQDEIVRFQALIGQVAEKWDPIFKSADLGVAQLAFAIARKIVGSVVDAQDDLVLTAVRDCLAHVQDVTKLTICVNPEDLNIVRANRTVWQEAYERIESMTIEADDAVERGGCVIETPSGDIDGQISSRLEKLQTAILERLQGMPQETVPDVSDVVAESQGQEDTGAEDDDVQSVVSTDERDAEEVVQEAELEEGILEADAQVVGETESEQDEDGAPVQVEEVEASEESETVTSVTEVVDGDRDELANSLEDEETLPEPDAVRDIETEDDSAHEDTSDMPQDELSDIDVSDESGGDEMVSDTLDENSLDMTQSDMPDSDALDDVDNKEVTDDSDDENSLDMTLDDSDQSDIGDEQIDAIDMQTDENVDAPNDATNDDDEAKQS